MTKSMKILAMAAAVSVLAAPCALAMDNVVLKVDVPFDFVVADQQLPSGEYRIVKDPGHRCRGDLLEGPTSTWWLRSASPVPADRRRPGSSCSTSTAASTS